MHAVYRAPSLAPLWWIAQPPAAIMAACGVHERKLVPPLPCLLLFLRAAAAAVKKANLCRGLTALLLVFFLYQQEVPQTRGRPGRPYRAARPAWGAKYFYRNTWQGTDIYEEFSSR
jgi:hypothetical protein